MKKPNTNVYLLYGHGEVVYVGISTVPIQKIETHKSSGKVFNSFAIFPCNEEASQNLKIEYLFCHHPKYNKTISISSPSCRLIGKITSTENKKVSIPCVIIDNRLYADFSGTGFDLKNVKSREDDEKKQ